MESEREREEGGGNGKGTTTPVCVVLQLDGLLGYATAALFIRRQDRCQCVIRASVGPLSPAPQEAQNPKS